MNKNVTEWYFAACLGLCLGCFVVAMAVYFMAEQTKHNSHVTECTLREDYRRLQESLDLYQSRIEYAVDNALCEMVLAREEFQSHRQLHQPLWKWRTAKPTDIGMVARFLLPAREGYFFGMIEDYRLRDGCPEYQCSMPNEHGETTTVTVIECEVQFDANEEPL